MGIQPLVFGDVSSYIITPIDIWKWIMAIYLKGKYTGLIYKPVYKVPVPSTFTRWYLYLGGGNFHPEPWGNDPI